MPPRGRSAELLAISLEAMWRFRLRTALSVLGIVIGVAAFVAMLSVSEGGRRAALRQVDRLGLRNMVVRAHNTLDGRAGKLRLSDAVRVSQLVPDIVRVEAVIERRGAVRGPAATLDTPVLGVTGGYLTLRQIVPARGRTLQPTDLGAQQVCVIGAGLARALFGAREPLGATIGVDGKWLTVVGVMDTTAAEADDDPSVRSADHDGAVLMPLPVLFGNREFPPDREVSQIWLEAMPGTVPMVVKAQTERAFEALHTGARDVEVAVPQELLAQRLATQRIFNVVVGSIAVLTLLVGGIGIMNIMLASVLERTQEIGLRRTVGATRRWILAQFVVETVTMTTTGGLVGLAAGALVAMGVNIYAGWPIYVSAWAIISALTTAVAIGLVFGIYPAARAARLQPIDAVRFE